MVVERRSLLTPATQLSWIGIALFAVWGMGVNVLAFRLRGHLKNPDETEFFGLFPRGIYLLDFFKPSLFTEEGNRIRVRAVAWFVFGGLGVLLAIALLSPR